MEGNRGEYLGEDVRAKEGIHFFFFNMGEIAVVFMLIGMI